MVMIFGILLMFAASVNSRNIEGVFSILEDTTLPPEIFKTNFSVFNAADCLTKCLQIQYTACSYHVEERLCSLPDRDLLFGVTQTKAGVITVVPTCPSNWRLYNFQCYRLFKTKKTWDEANEKCEEYVHGMLAKDDTSMNYLSKWADDANKSIWFGLRKSFRHTEISNLTVFNYVDGSHPRIFKWDLGDVLHQNRLCIRMFKDSTNPDKSWRDTDCDQEKQFFCQL